MMRGAGAFLLPLRPLLGPFTTWEIAVVDNAGVRKAPYLTNARAKELTADGVRQAVRQVGKDKLAKAGDVDVRTIEKWIAEGSLPAVDHLLNMADEDPIVLRQLLAEKGWVLTPSHAEPANDMQLAAGLGHTLGEFLERLRDGVRCHVDTAVIAALFRELIPQMQAIVDEDDARRRAA
jgi:hypothetical protein